MTKDINNYSAQIGLTEKYIFIIIKNEIKFK